MTKPAFALYLGETYATIGLFETADLKKSGTPIPLWEKSVFLPQISLKNLLNQAKTQLTAHFADHSAELPVYIVTKYFDRLKQFRLGGSISQVLLKGFENSYTFNDSKSLSLAASQLIISLEAGQCEPTQLAIELERIKKINPDLNKVVIALPEDKFSNAQLEIINQYFTTAGLKIFICTQPYNQNELRKTLLNAGSEGTKEEICTDIKEILGENSAVHFFCHDGFRQEFQNCELFNSAGNFFAHFLKLKKLPPCAYFDIESFRYLQSAQSSLWQSPWGPIPVSYFHQTDLSVHPFAEVKLNHLSMLQIENSVTQLEPGPVVSGRAIKPLVLDLFFDELRENRLAQNLFSQIGLDTIKTKITNLFSVLEKGQKNSTLFTSIADLKSSLLKGLSNEIRHCSSEDKVGVIGPLAALFGRPATEFSWPAEIMAVVAAKGTP